MNFDSPGAFAAHLRRVAVSLPTAERRGLEAGAKLIEAEAKAEIGHYQEGAGPFAEWKPLAEATKADRVRLGYTPDDPLLRSGELLNSIGHGVEGHKAVVGSTSEIALYQELGTAHIPPRSFLGGAAVRTGERVANEIGGAIAHAVAGKPPRNT